MKVRSLIEVISPQPGSKILVCDVHASESGALSILNDFYEQVSAWPDKSVTWYFVVSTPEFRETSNIKVKRFPWVKKGWLHRLFFECFCLKRIINQIRPQKSFSLQNKGVSCFKGHQIVYLHLPFILTDHRFSLIRDGKILWLYQNIVKKLIFTSLKKVDTTIVQTGWMKSSLMSKAHISEDKIVVLTPNIGNKVYSSYVDTPAHRKSFFYPATAFTYKNHFTLLKAVAYAVEKGLQDYSVTFTILPDENSYTQKLYSYASNKKLSINFIGPISREKVFEHYSQSVLLFPSFVESFGLPLLEAKMTGCYIIASDTPFAREILQDYDKVRFFEELDYKKMGDEILALQKL